MENIGRLPGQPSDPAAAGFTRKIATNYSPNLAKADNLLWCNVDFVYQLR
jgi:hypothetical protein